jgi:TRAP-type C4-dicarboxylate transport system permease large subunit
MLKKKLRSAIGRTNPNDSLWRIWPYIGALIVSLLIVAAIPWLSIGFL